MTTSAIIINPKAGTNSSRKGVQLVTDFANKAEIPLYFTEYRGHARELCQQLKHNFTTIIAAGGDGTINEIAGELVHTDTALGIIPLGSGNGLARHLKIPVELVAAIDLLKNKPHQIDTLTINGKIVVNIGGLGFDAHIADLFNRTKNRGIWAYFKLILREVFNFKELHYSLASVTTNINSKAFMILFANGSEFGNRFIINPDADCTSGLFQTIVVRKPPIYALPKLLIAGYKGTLKPSKYYQKFQLNEVVLHPERAFPIQCDGEISYPTALPLNIKINPLSLKVIY